jgi:ATP/maltotriose-dependent transcriptional regulator MalT
VLEELNENARSLRLMSDLNRNLLLLNQLYWQAGRKKRRSSACCWKRCSWLTAPGLSVTL